jgi:hypothetical protein
MAFNVKTGTTQVISTIVRDPTIVKSVTVGVPIGSINLPGTTFAGLFDVDVTTGLTEGDFVKYNNTAGMWQNVDLQAQIDSDLNTLQVQITGKDADILALFANDSATAANIVTLFAQFTANDSDILALQAADSATVARFSASEIDLYTRIGNNDSDITAVQLSQAAAVSSVQTQIDSNEAFFKGIINSDSDVRVAGDLNLQIQIDSNEVLMRSLDSIESTARVAADTSLQVNLDSSDAFFRNRFALDSTARVAADAILQTQIDSNEAFFRSTIAADSDIRAAADLNLQTQIDSNESFFKGRINTDSDARVASNLNLQTQIDSNEALLRILDSAESAARVAADGAIQGQVDSNESFFRSRFDTDSDARVAADANLQTQIDSNESFFKGILNADSDARVAGDTNLQTQIDSNETLFRILDSTESAARVASDLNLQTQIDSNEALLRILDSAESADRVASDLNLQTQIDSSEAFFKGRLDTDSDVRVASDLNLQTQIDSNYGVSRSTDSALLTQITNNDSDIAFILSGGTSVDSAGVLSIVQPLFDSNNTIIESLKAVDTTLQANIDSNASATSALKLGLQTQIDSDGGRITALDPRIANAQSGVDSNSTDINALFTSTNTLQTNIDSNATDISTLNTSANTLQSNIDSNATDIGTLNTNVDSNATDINTLFTSANTLQDNIDSNSTDINTLFTSANTLQSNIDSNATDINTLSANDVTLQSNIDSNATDINALSANDVTLQSNIDSNATDINTLFGADVTLQSNIDSLNTNKLNIDGDGSSLTGIGVQWSRKTSNYTAITKNAIIADTNAGSWTLTLPASPSTGDYIQVLDGDDWSTNNLTVARNGSTIDGTAADLTLDIGNVSVDFVYDGTTWQLSLQLGGTGGDVVTLNGIQTLTNKTLTSATLTSATLSGTTTAGPINATGTVAATDFTGDGSALTGIAAGVEWELKTTTYAAATRDAIIANTSSGIWTLTLPASPTTGDYVQVIDGDDWAANNLTIARNGETIEGSATDLIANVGGISINLIFDGTTWQVAVQAGGQGGDVATLTGTQTLTNKTLTSPIHTGTTTVDALVVNANNYPSAGSLSGRNRIINSDFGLWRRATSGSANGYVAADRWVNFVNVATKTITRTSFAVGQTDVPNDPQYYASSVVVGDADVTSFAIDQQRIEGVRTFNGKTVAISFWCKADAPKNIAFEFEQSFGTGGSPSASITGIGAQLIAVTGSWAKYTITVAVPSISGKTLGSNNDDNLSVNIWYSAGTDYSARTDSLSAQSGTFDLAQVQIEEGDVATPFERVDASLELAKCLRYYQQFSYRARFGATGGGEEDGRVLPFPTQMRAAPTVSTTSSSAVNISSVSFSSADGISFTAGVTPTTGGGTDWNGILTWDAEI